MEAKWLILAVLIPSALFLYGFVIWIFIKLPRGMAELAEDAGWKKIGWGIYMAGPYGGPYKEPAMTEQAAAASRTHPARRAWLLILGVLTGEILAVMLGALIAHTLGIGAVAGALMGFIAFALLIGLLWIGVGGISLRRELTQRGRATPH